MQLALSYLELWPELAMPHSQCFTILLIGLITNAPTKGKKRDLFTWIHSGISAQREIFSSMASCITMKADHSQSMVPGTFFPLSINCKRYLRARLSDARIGTLLRVNLMVRLLKC